MSLNPKDWRAAAKLSLAAVAAKAGITGQNPARTYVRYESGACICPTEIVETVSKLSAGAVEPNDWHRARVGFLNSQRREKTRRRA